MKILHRRLHFLPSLPSLFLGQWSVERTECQIQCDDPYLRYSWKTAEKVELCVAWKCPGYEQENLWNLKKKPSHCAFHIVFLLLTKSSFQLAEVLLDMPLCKYSAGMSRRTNQNMWTACMAHCHEEEVGQSWHLGGGSNSSRSARSDEINLHACLSTGWVFKGKAGWWVL